MIGWPFCVGACDSLVTLTSSWVRCLDPRISVSTEEEEEATPRFLNPNISSV